MKDWLTYISRKTKYNIYQLIAAEMMLEGITTKEAHRLFFNNPDCPVNHAVTTNIYNALSDLEKNLFIKIDDIKKFL